MNLIFRLFIRLLWAELQRRFRGPTGLLDEIRLTFRCLPTDLDANLHLTNSRYFSFMDIVRVAMMVRSGTWQRIRTAKLMPVLGSSSIRYRRAVKTVQQVTVTCRVIGWDDRWLFLEHRILIDGKTGEDAAAIAVMKTAFLGPDGRVATDKLIEVVGFQGTKPDSGPLIDRVRDVDAALTA